jgi:hypothetical protein
MFNFFSLSLIFSRKSSSHCFRFSFTFLITCFLRFRFSDHIIEKLKFHLHLLRFLFRFCCSILILSFFPIGRVSWFSWSIFSISIQFHIRILFTIQFTIRFDFVFILLPNSKHSTSIFHFLFATVPPSTLILLQITVSSSLLILRSFFTRLESSSTCSDLDFVSNSLIYLCDGCRELPICFYIVVVVCLRYSFRFVCAFLMLQLLQFATSSLRHWLVESLRANCALKLFVESPHWKKAGYCVQFDRADCL